MMHTGEPSLRQASPVVNPTLEPETFPRLARTLLGDGFSITFEARGHSMEPFIRDGDTVEVEPAADGSMGAGDIVLFVRQGGRAVLHRVYRLKDGVLHTRGDAALNLEESLSPDEVLGKAVRVKKGGHWVRLDTMTSRGLAGLWSCLRPVRRLWAGLVRRSP